ncbi:MAG: hypothetical protein AAF085_15335 [Planctomycetota bacterium]
MTPTLILATTQSFEQWFQQADDALPTLTMTARWAVFGVGIALWLAGGKLLKAAVMLGGLMLGMIVGALSIAFVDSPGIAIGFMAGLGLLGVLSAWLMFRAWVAFAAAIMFAIAAPAGVIIWQGVPAQQLSDDTQQATEQVQQRYDALATQLNDQTKLKVEELMQQGDQAALVEADQLLAEQGEQALEAAKTAVFQNLEDLQAWWNDSSSSLHRQIGLAMLIGAGIGLLFGFIAPSYAASIQSAMVGAVLIVIPGRELIASYLPAAAEFVPTTARGTLITLGLITVLGVGLQWTLYLRRVDKTA